MNLTDEQKLAVTQWVEAGMSASDIQKRIKEDFDLSLTYLELRFLLGDLKVVPKEKERPPEPAETPSPTPPAPEDAGAVPGKVRVSIDRITKPSALISGKVTFSDGETAEWLIDTAGRPAVVPTRAGYRPSQQDIMEFQMELQRMM